MKSGWRANLELNLALASSLPAFMDVLVASARDFWLQTESLSDSDLQEFKHILVQHLERVLRNAKVSGDLPVESLIAQLEQSKSQFHRLVELGDLLIVRTSERFEILEVRGNTERLLGVAPDELLSDPFVWRRFLEDRELRHLRLRLRSASLAEELSAEVRVVNRKTGETRWLLVKGVPILSAEGKLVAWEGLGLDITEKHESQQDLLQERKRLKALYEVSSALQVAVDPAVASLKGIRALKQATSSDCAYACFYDESQNLIEVVASEGFREESAREISLAVNGTSLTRMAIEDAAGFFVDDLEADERVAAPDVMHRETLKSGIFAPLIQDGKVIGAVALFSRKRARYREGDLNLLNSALQQLSLAVRQAEYFASERRQANVVSTLYQLSHELSRLMTPREMAAHAFPIIQGELACKRMWLGMMNDQGSHLVGQAGMGPGVRRSIIDLQIDLSERHDFLDQAIKSKEAAIVPASQDMECSSLNRLRSRLEIGLMIIVPLVSLGQVVGILLLEPAVSSHAVVHRKLPLLKNMAGEMATIMLARRFEGKMAEADKMRMAGVLASGVAHNFNNLLQAVMGQASLIEMQLPANSPLLASTRMILDSAGKGASLIKQLMSFSMQGNSVRRTLSVNSMITESQDLYRSLLGSRLTLALKLADGVPPVYADHSQLQQVITNLLINARDAIGDKKDGQVMLTTSEVRVRPGELDPELAPGIYLRVDVQDNGVGMDAERLARCFEPFYTTKNLDTRTGLSLTGAGLGLSSSYSLIKQHEGIISARSRAGEGSVFSVYLPALTVRSEEPDAEDTIGKQPLRPQGEALFAGVDRAKFDQAARQLEKVAVRSKSIPAAAQLSHAISDDVIAVVLAVPEGKDRSAAFAAAAAAFEQQRYNGAIVIIGSDSSPPAELGRFAAQSKVVAPPYLLSGVEKAVREQLRQFDAGGGPQKGTSGKGR